jgi:hypothetical protein
MRGMAAAALLLAIYYVAARAWAMVHAILIARAAALIGDLMR